MDKAKIQVFSDTVREKLFSEIQHRAMLFGISSEKIFDVDQEFEDSIVINGTVFDKKIKEQRERLIKEINEIGYEQVIDEVTYTWFNRFIALKYMERNEYIPVQVVSSKEPGKLEPDIIKEALSLNFLDIERDVVLDLKSAGNTEGLYKYLVLNLCNYLNEIMPFLFEKIDDYTELLFPDKLLHTDSILADLNKIIPRDYWTEVEIIGWIYQYYIAKKKNKLIQAKKKYKTTEIPAVTQLFTPKWIVEYMVQNSLGRFWLESHPNKELQSTFDFYLESREEQYLNKLKEYINTSLNPEEITFIDPAMGSGHILVYAFDIFYRIYKIRGYLDNKIPELILTKNLYGLEIDDRASQLAGFALLMKARQYDKQLFEKKIELNLVSIQESNTFSDYDIRLFAGNEIDQIKVEQLFSAFKDAKTFGSIIRVGELDCDFFKQKLNEFEQSENLRKYAIIDKIKIIIKQMEIIMGQYDIAVTNPPYLPGSKMPDLLKQYVQRNYPNTKTDLFSVFIELLISFTKQKGQFGVMCPFVFMFIKSYTKLRENIINNKNISTLIQLEYSGFKEAVVPICTFTIRNYKIDIKGEYVRLSDFKGAENQPIKTKEAIQNPNVTYRYTVNSKEFSKISGTPIAYWVSDKVRETFDKSLELIEIAEPKQGLATGDNEKFLRLWSEVNFNNIGFNFKDREEAKRSNFKWFPCNKGGPFKKWYGNNNFVVNWKNDGEDLYNFLPRSVIRNPNYYFKKGISWSTISSSSASFRLSPTGFIFETKGSVCFVKENDDFEYIFGFLNSKLVKHFLKAISPTLDYHEGPLGRLPVILKRNENIQNYVNDCIKLSKEDWDSRETSWDFQKNELLKFTTTEKIKDSYDKYCTYWKEKFFKMRKNEEELNRIFIDIYSLSDEINPYISFEEITTLLEESAIKNDDLIFKKDIIVKQFVSHAVGCIFGRYSLDKEGLILVNQGETLDDFKEKVPNASFIPDDDNIIPVLGDEYFEDDIVFRFKEFLKDTFGSETLSENLDFIADALSGRSSESSEQIIRKYFINDFFKDHCKMYKKRPIYWLFTSGPEKTFNALIYMHRYDKTTLAKMRTDYLNELQAKLDAKKTTLKLDSTDTIEKNRAQQELVKINKQLEETVEYHKLLKNKGDQFIEIDLDDGVKVNYEKFKGLVAKI